VNWNLGANYFWKGWKDREERGWMDGGTLIWLVPSSFIHSEVHMLSFSIKVSGQKP
jgi:hypothetical protein